MRVETTVSWVFWRTFGRRVALARKQGVTPPIDVKSDAFLDVLTFRNALRGSP